MLQKPPFQSPLVPDQRRDRGQNEKDDDVAEKLIRHRMSGSSAYGGHRRDGIPNEWCPIDGRSRIAPYSPSDWNTVMKSCPACGQVVSENKRFCSYCGEKLSESEGLQ